MKLVITSFAVLALGGAALAQPPAEAPVADPAAGLFTTRCAGCHNDFVNNAPTLFTLQSYKPDVIVTAMKTGKMQRMAMGLSDDEMTSIAKFITTKTGT